MSKPSANIAKSQKLPALKIGLVLDDTLDTPDGVAQYVLTLGGWLSAQGHEVHYLVGETSRKDLDHLHSLSRNLKVRYNGNRMTTPLPAPMRKLRMLMKTEQFDVLHVQVPYSPMLGARLVLAAGSRTAVIGTFHILPYSRAAYLASQLLALVLTRSRRRFDSLLSVSAAAQIFARQAFRMPSKVMPNAFDYDRFHQARGWPQYVDDTLTIVFLGRLVPRKGCRLLLEAVRLLSERHKLPKFRVIICGKGPLRDELQDYVAKYGLGAAVEFTGFVSEADKPRYYASADITVFPSTGGESFGIVLLEAMASGHAAVLAGDNPGYHSVMAPRSGLLFDPHRADELADKLASLMRKPQQRQAAADWGEEYAEQFDVGAVGPKIVALYNEALRKRREP